MKIKKYASGGVYTPFDPPIQTNAASKTKTSGSSGSSKSPDLPFTKELIELISAKGLPSDSAVFSEELAQVLYRAQVSGADLPAYMTVAFANKANTMSEMKSDHDKAYDKVIERETGNDIATHDQFMYVEDLSKPEDEREMALITPAQYLENPKQWKVLTNQEILHARKYDKNFAFNASTIISDAASSTNLKRIRDYWRDETKALATQSNSGVLSNQSVQIQDYITGAKLLQSVNGEIDSSTTLQNEHVQNYLSFLYSSMDEKSKGYLHNYMAVKGIEPSGQNILEFMYSNIVDYVATSTKYSPEGKGKGKGSGNGDGDDLTGTTQDNQAIRIQQFLGPQEKIIFKCKPGSPSEDMGAFETIAIKQGQFITNDGNPIQGPLMLNELMGKALAFAATDTRSVYLGNKYLSDAARTKVCWAGSEIEEVLLPPIRQEDGTVRPWFELMSYLGKANSGNYSQTEVWDYLLKQGIDKNAIKYNSITNKWELLVDTIPFLVFKAYTGVERMDFADSDLQYFEDVSNKDGKYILPYIDEAYGGRKFWTNDDDADDIYAGNVYIPIASAWATFNSTANQYIPKEQFNDVNRKQIAEQIVKQSQQDSGKKTINSNFTK